MTNDLAVIPLVEITALGKIFAESGLFTDVKSQSQAVVRILAGQEIGIPAFAAISGIHIIQGKPTIGAGLMASRVKGSGKYDYKVKEHTDKICSIDFYEKEQRPGGAHPVMIGNSTFTIEDAKKAGTKNLDKFPKNMLFARALSNGVKFFTPDIFAGPVYVPEEMGSITEDVQHEEVRIITKETVDKFANGLTAKKAISEKQFAQLQQRIADSPDQDAAMQLLSKAQETFTVSDEQAQQLVNSISILPIPQTT